MPRPVSPAAGAAISRLLSGAGITRATEHSKGIEYEGFWAEPRGDHVRVDYTPSYWVEPDDALPVIKAGLARCKSVLLRSHYEVAEVTEANYVYGGNPPISAPVLEVRRASWTRRDTDA